MKNCKCFDKASRKNFCGSSSGIDVNGRLRLELRGREEFPDVGGDLPGRQNLGARRPLGRRLDKERPEVVLDLQSPLVMQPSPATKLVDVVVEKQVEGSGKGVSQVFLSWGSCCSKAISAKTYSSKYWRLWVRIPPIQYSLFVSGVYLKRFIMGCFAVP